MRSFSGFSTRALLICVVLGAFTAVFVHLSRILGVVFWAAAPWLGAPAPVIPWFLTIIVAALLVGRLGAALLTALIGTVVGIGAMALLAGVVVEVVFALARARHGGRLAPGDRAGLWWAMIAGALTGAMSYGFMFLVPEFRLLSAQLMVLALGVRLVTGVLFGALAHVVVQGLLRAGFDPDRRAGSASAEGGSS